MFDLFIIIIFLVLSLINGGIQGNKQMTNEYGTRTVMTGNNGRESFGNKGNQVHIKVPYEKVINKIDKKMFELVIL